MNFQILNHFINKQDYDATIHKEILDALTREDESILDICEERAISEMKSYMAGRYDVEAIFNARGSERHPLILMMAIDIATYHIFTIHNPQKLTGIRKDRYERAVEWLKHVSRGQVIIEGAPPKPEGERASEYRMHSNPKRVNHF